MCTWTSQKNKDYSCRQPSEPGSDLCVFHSPLPKDTQSFLDALKSQVEGKTAEEVRNERYDFTGYTFPVFLLGEPQEGFNARDHRAAIVRAYKTILRAGQDLVDATADLNKAEFLLLLGTTEMQRFLSDIVADAPLERLFILPRHITGDLILTEAKLSDLALNGSVVDGSIVLDGSEASGSILLTGVSVCKTLDLSEATIENSLVLLESTIDKGVNLRRILVRGGTVVIGCKLGRNLDVNGLVLEGRTCFSDSTAGDVFVREDTLRFLWKSGVKIRDKKCGWTFWRFARRVYENNDDRGRADASFYYERSGRIRAKCLEGGWLNRAVGVASYVANLFVRIPVAYGTSLLQTLASWVAVIISFAGIYHTTGVILDATDASVSSFFECVYFSVVTFTTLGYGDLHPSIHRPRGGLGSQRSDYRRCTDCTHDPRGGTSIHAVGRGTRTGESTVGWDGRIGQIPARAIPGIHRIHMVHGFRCRARGSGLVLCMRGILGYKSDFQSQLHNTQWST